MHHIWWRLHTFVFVAEREYEFQFLVFGLIRLEAVLRVYRFSNNVFKHVDITFTPLYEYSHQASANNNEACAAWRNYANAEWIIIPNHGVSEILHFFFTSVPLVVVFCCASTSFAMLPVNWSQRSGFLFPLPFLPALPLIIALPLTVTMSSQTKFPYCYWIKAKWSIIASAWR